MTKESAKTKADPGSKDPRFMKTRFFSTDRNHTGWERVVSRTQYLTSNCRNQDTWDKSGLIQKFRKLQGDSRLSGFSIDHGR